MQSVCRTESAARQATLRLSLRAGFLERREKWRTSNYFGQCLKNKPALYFPVKVAHPPGPSLRTAFSLPSAVLLACSAQVHNLWTAARSIGDRSYSVDDASRRWGKAHEE